MLSCYGLFPHTKLRRNFLTNDNICIYTLPVFIFLLYSRRHKFESTFTFYVCLAKLFVTKTSLIRIYTMSSTKLLLKRAANDTSMLHAPLLQSCLHGLHEISQCLQTNTLQHSLTSPHKSFRLAVVLCSALFYLNCTPPNILRPG